MYVSLSPNSDTSGLQFDMNPAAWLTMRNRDLGGGLTWHHARPRLSDRHPGASTRRTCRLLILYVPICRGFTSTDAATPRGAGGAGHPVSGARPGRPDVGGGGRDRSS